jgi:hypothetical protein
LAAIGTDPRTGASLETNQDDYSPGEVVHLIGSGWAPNETIHLFMSEEPDTHGDVSRDVIADSSGRFAIHFYDVQAHDVGVLFTLTGTGETSGSTVTVQFTDGRQIESVALTPPNPSAAGVNVTAQVRVVLNSGSGPKEWFGTKWEIRNASNLVVASSPLPCLNTANHTVGDADEASGNKHDESFSFTAPVAGPYTLTVSVYSTNDCSGALSPTVESVSFTVGGTNTAPTLNTIGNKTVDELVALGFTATAADTDTPTQTLTFSLAAGAPAGASITSGGVFSWTPPEAQGPGVYPVTIVVTDNGAGSLSDQETINVQVNEVNVPPLLTAIGDKAVNELALLSFTATATDADLPANTLVFSLQGVVPTGAAITPAGAFTWTPTEDQGLGTYPVTIRVTDNGTGALYDEETINVQVNEVNVAPVLTAVGDKAVDEHALLSFTATATDADGNPLAFSIAPAATGTFPTGAVMTSAGVFTWTPNESQGGATFRVRINVNDGTTDDFEEIAIVVTEVNAAPALTPIGNKIGDELTLLSFTAAATDSDVPANTLAFSLQGTVPAGVAMTPAGAFTWTPTEAQGPGNYSVTIRVTDNGTPAKWDEETISIEVKEVNVAPVLAAIGGKTVNELATLNFTASATDDDVPENDLTFTLGAGAPAGAAITPAGAFSWTPTEAQGPATYSIKVVVTDNGTPAKSAYETISVQVNEVNVAPVLHPIGSKTVAEGSLLSFTASADDADLPANTLTYSLGAGAPDGATINSTTGLFSWTPPNGPATASITVRVTDNGTPALNDFEMITVNVTNVAPEITTINFPVSPISIGTSATLKWFFTDPGADTWTCSIIWDAGMSEGPATYLAPKSCTANTQTLAAGVYTAKMFVNDGAAMDDSLATEYIVVYDPSGGFVTGGGWIMSPAGAYVPAPGLTGKATFGFVSKYEKGKTLPQGNTEFQFHAGNMNFKSTSYEWLVVAGTRAQYKGEGAIENVAGTFGFLLTAVDGGNTSAGVNPDKFRIKIWNKATNQVVYDNQIGEVEDSDSATGLSGGSIVIHSKK